MQTKVEDRGIGMLLAVAGWTGGGVVTGILIQIARTPVGQPAFPTATPVDSFLAVVSGCFLVGPLVAGALLWRWHQPRPVGTVVTLCVLGLLASVPLLVLVSVLIHHGAAALGILVFVVGWGVVLPAAARTYVVRATRGALARDFAEPGPVDLLRAAGFPVPAEVGVAVGAAAPGGSNPSPSAWTPIPDDVPLASLLTAPPGGSQGTPVPGAGEAGRPGPPVDPRLPPIVLPPDLHPPTT